MDDVDNCPVVVVCSVDVVNWDVEDVDDCSVVVVVCSVDVVIVVVVA